MLPPGALDHRQSCKIGKLPALGQGKESKVFQARLLALSVLLKHEQDLQRARRRLARPASGIDAGREQDSHSD